ncbi:MAG: 50S ribosomal protein L1 [Planctomycetes bacterium]|nr:50S ribosomal protein L1 [Planctomycetota bacterium]MCC7169794.1 50S ribosomal protein L1 [Planctomycetota bacterium]
MNGSKRFRANRALIPGKGPFALGEAVKVLKKFKPAKFDETVELVMNLGIDPKKSDQMIRGAVSLPKGIGKNVRVVVFCKDDKAKLALDAGAIAAGGDDLAAKIRDQNWLDFDVAIATPDMMGVVGRLGKILGPQGKMPSPKSGTVTPDIVKAVTEFRAGKIEFRADAYGNVHAPVGKISFDAASLQENVTALVDMILHMKPAASKGKYINKVAISTTMGPSLILDITG